MDQSNLCAKLKEAQKTNCTNDEKQIRFEYGLSKKPEES